MKRLKSVENDQVQLEVVECDCGFHYGIDATYLDQEGDCRIICPSCKSIIDTSNLCPEDEADELPDWIHSQSTKPSEVLRYFEGTQGWNESTQLLLLLAFLDSRDNSCGDWPNLNPDFISYLKERSENNA